jgi:hypothetical protein
MAILMTTTAIIGLLAGLIIGGMRRADVGAQAPCG